MKLIPLLLSLTLFAQANICETQFLKHAKVENPAAVQAQARSSLNKLFDMTRNAQTTREKLDLLEEQYDLISRLFETRKEAARARVAAMNLPEKEANEILKTAMVEIIDDIKLYPNRIVNEAQKLFREAGIPVDVHYRKYGDSVRVKYLELGNIDGATSQAVKKIQRYKERFGTEFVTFDIFENITIGSAGFSVAQIARIDLGVRGMRNLILDDVITMVGKHEFHHAAFAAKRNKDVSSIYHTQYFANGEKNLASSGNGYQRFMSAEELYNWANNSFWASERLLNTAKFSPVDYIYDINRIYSYLSGTEQLAKQTREITRNAIDSVKLMRQEIKTGEFDIIFLTEQGAQATVAEEAFTMVLFDTERKIMIHEFMGKEYADDVAAIFDSALNVEAKYIDEINAAMEADKMQDYYFNKLRPEYVKASEKNLRSILRTFEERQKVLRRVAVAVEKDAKAVTEETGQFMKRLQAELDANKGENLGQEAWNAEFRALAQRYRKLGNIVKEDYKGFAGR